jgi:hypothetical protein
MKVFIGRYPKGMSKKRKIDIRIDDYDVWNMDDTLAHIIHPMLLKIQEDKHGAPPVDDEDVPDNIRRINAPNISELREYETDDFWFARWDYVIGEMIFAFESKLKDWEDPFWSKQPQKESTIGIPVLVDDCDWDGMKAYAERMQNGFRLFGKYYEGLWT